MKSIFIVFTLIISLYTSCSDKKSNTNTKSTNQTNNNDSNSNSNNKKSKTISQGLYHKFKFEINEYKNDFIVRFFHNKKVISRLNFIKYLIEDNQDSSTFRYMLNSSISGLDRLANEVEIKIPIINSITSSKEFYYVAKASPFNTGSSISSQYKNYFFHCKPKMNNSDIKSIDYKDNFLGISYKDLKNNSTLTLKTKSNLNRYDQFPRGSVSFKTSEGNILVSPCPFNSDTGPSQTDYLLHFTKAIEESVLQDYIHTFWFMVGKMAHNLYSNNEAIFLNTKGNPINYLHFRIDKNPIYYTNSKELISEESSIIFYKTVFD